jgi:alanine-glyoxylate transaminase/serine-glyoxylate transaminase/serine-pyruvate transaminase
MPPCAGPISSLDMVKMNADGYFPYTPPTPLLRGLRAALDRLFREGLDEVIARHARIAEGVRRGVHAWGLELVAEHPSLYSDTVSAIRVPQDVDARDVLRIAYDEMNTSFGSGLARLQGKVFRIGHLGDFNEGMALTALSIAEMALVRAGAQIQLGAGVAAAQRHFTGAAMANPVLRVAAE